MALTEIDGISSLNNKLNETTTEHEESLVVDRSYDRVVKWVGVYLIFVLAVLFQVMEFAGECKAVILNLCAARNFFSVQRIFLSLYD